MARNKLLTKSKYLIGLQCPKYLWVRFNDPDRIPAVDMVTQYKMDQGNKVGNLAKRLFPDGVDISKEDFIQNVNQTKEAVKQNKILFEPGILVDNIFARADILHPQANGAWDIIEVKSSTQVKDLHIRDVAFQKYCYEKFGLNIRKCFIAYINNQYVRKGDVDVKDFFMTEEITNAIEDESIGIQGRIDNMFKIIASKQCPDVRVGKQCSNPYNCPLKEDCWKILPKNNVFRLYRGGKNSLALFERGICAIKDIPDTFKLSDKQQIQKSCELTNKAYVNSKAIRDFLNTLDYPLYYFDLETINPGIPFFDDTKPYQKIPFQFSLHVVNGEGSAVEQHSFLVDGIEDPRPQFLARLKDVLGDKGSIIVYNQSFEKTVLKELGENFLEYREWANGVLERIKDLLVPFRSFDYYHPEQQGSASLKEVLPVLTGKRHSELEINDGETANVAFLEVTYKAAPEEKRKKVRCDLEKYCCLDTEGMIWIMDELKKMI